MVPNPISSVRGKSATVGFQRRLEIPALAAGAELQYDVDTSPDIRHSGGLGPLTTYRWSTSTRSR